MPAGSVFYCSGLHFEPVPPTGPVTAATPALLVRGSTTRVALDRCVLVGSGYIIGLGRRGGDALAIENAHVFAAGCPFFGGSVGVWYAFTAHGGHGVLVAGGALLATDCSFEGGFGQITKRGDNSSGGDGLHVVAGQASAHGCAFIGGYGGFYFGGNGIALATGSAFVRVAGRASNYARAGRGFSADGVAVAASAPSSAAAVIHGPVQLLPGSPGGPITTGNVALATSTLPRVWVAAPYTAHGEIPLGSAVSVEVEGALAGAPILLGFAPQPELSTLPPLVLGEIVLPVPAFRFGAVLDGTGRFSHFFPPSIVPAYVGVPVFGQVAELDVAGNEIRMSNLELQLWSN